MKGQSVWSEAAVLVLTCSLLGMIGCGDSEPASSAESLTAAEPVKWPLTEDAALKPGLDVFAQVCSRCHIESDHAPLISDPKEWEKRLARAEQGIDTLATHAIEGFGDMGPKGGRRGKDLTDEQVKSAVRYMLWAAGRPLAG